MGDAGRAEDQREVRESGVDQKTELIPLRVLNVLADNEMMSCSRWWRAAAPPSLELIRRVWRYHSSGGKGTKEEPEQRRYCHVLNSPHLQPSQVIL